MRGQNVSKKKLYPSCGIVVEKLMDSAKSSSVVCPRRVKSMSGSMKV